MIFHKRWLAEFWAGCETYELLVSGEIVINVALGENVIMFDQKSIKNISIKPIKFFIRRK